MTQNALAIVKAAIDAVDPHTAVQTHVMGKPGSLQIGSNTYKENDYDQVVLISFGKASSAMAVAAVERLEQCLPSLDITGVVICKDDHATKDELMTLQKYDIHVQEASHPVPNLRSVQGARKIVDLLQTRASERTLVVCCISGGGSALCCAPKPPLTLKDLMETNQALLNSGLKIQNVNVIRKRLEIAKGGRLAAAAYPSTVVTLVLSDILGDPLDLIASGPTVPDTSTFEDAIALVEQNSVLQSTLPPAVMKFLKDGSKSNDEIPLDVFNKCDTVLVGNNELAVTAAADEALRLGYNPVVIGTSIEGEACHVAGVYVSMAHYLSQQNNRGVPYAMSLLPAAIIGGGETTVTLPGDKMHNGKGGRNQELALSAAVKLRDLSLRNVVLASVGTDGTDGPTDAAGAVVDAGTLDRLQHGSAVEALQQHDAYTYFSQEKDGPLIMTGPTGTNVADVCVTLVR